jgi:hypothetical protein
MSIIASDFTSSDIKEVQSLDTSEDAAYKALIAARAKSKEDKAAIDNEEYRLINHNLLSNGRYYFDVTADKFSKLTLVSNSNKIVRVWFEANFQIFWYLRFAPTANSTTNSRIINDWSHKTSTWEESVAINLDDVQSTNSYSFIPAYIMNISSATPNTNVRMCVEVVEETPNPPVVVMKLARKEHHMDCWYPGKKSCVYNLPYTIFPTMYVVSN